MTEHLVQQAALQDMAEHVRVHDLHVRFPINRGVVMRKVVATVRAVDGISFTVGRGRTLGIVGESGCGKTTVVKTILGLQRPTEGEIRVNGVDVHSLRGTALREYRQAVQIVFQDPYSSLDPRMRIGNVINEPVQAGRGSRERRAGRERIAELMTLVGLDTDALRQYPHQFSGGQRQRIAIARALAPDPKLVLLDEPTSALDVSIRAQIMNLLGDLQQRFGLTYIMISHDLNAVGYMSTDIAVMYLGRIVETGSRDAIYKSPRHPYTRLLLSSTEAVETDGGTSHEEIPSAMNIPSGCRFRTRCALREELGNPIECEQQDPMLRVIGQQQVACHFAERTRSPEAGSLTGGERDA